MSTYNVTKYSTEKGTDLRTVSAQDIKRRGIGVVDEALKDGPVHVIKHNRPSYVIMDEEYYRELLEAQEEATIARVKASLEDVDEGRARSVTAQELIDELDHKN